ncbi:MAG: hypothetical protein KAQ87_00745 [Candidatus Pacebacteria bacterium]|nr:hypothetical protein [Candidatus Paceibacterota bacterium]
MELKIVIARSLSERSEREGDEAIPQLCTTNLITGLLRRHFTHCVRSGFSQ